MPQDYQKQEAKQCLWDQDGQHTKKRWRNRGKGRCKEKRDIRASLAELGSAAESEREEAQDQEMELAWYCHTSGPCEACKRSDEESNSERD